MGEKGCNDNIKPIPFPMRARDPNPPLEREGDFGLFTKPSWMRHDQKYAAGKDRLNRTGAGPGK
jgi:hypothetical protein